MTDTHNNEHVNNWQASKTTIKESFLFLFNNEKLSDIQFLVGKDDQQQKIPAHKLILAARSDVFETMFFGNLKTTSNKIELPDIDADSFLAFLKFLYTDTVEIDPEIVMSTLYVAKKYNVAKLEDHCVDFLEKNCNADNAFFLLSQARLFDEPRLADFCLDMIDRDAEKVFSSASFLDIDIDTLIEILNHDTLEIREFKLFEAVVRWSKAECVRKKLSKTPENQRSVLGEAFTLIRFPLIEINELIIGPVQSKLLTDREVVQLLLYLKGGDPKPWIPFLNKPRAESQSKLHGILHSKPRW